MNQSEMNFTENEPVVTLEELLAEYKAKVGVSARTNDPDALKQALENPDAERMRLAEEDAEDDKRDLEDTYRRRF